MTRTRMIDGQEKDRTMLTWLDGRSLSTQRAMHVAAQMTWGVWSLIKNTRHRRTDAHVRDLAQGKLPLPNMPSWLVLGMAPLTFVPALVAGLIGYPKAATPTEAFKQQWAQKAQYLAHTYQAPRAFWARWVMGLLVGTFIAVNAVLSMGFVFSGSLVATVMLATPLGPLVLAGSLLYAGYHAYKAHSEFCAAYDRLQQVQSHQDDRDEFEPEHRHLNDKELHAYFKEVDAVKRSAMLDPLVILEIRDLLEQERATRRKERVEKNEEHLALIQAKIPEPAGQAPQSQHRGVFSSLFHSRKNKKRSKKNQESAVKIPEPAGQAPQTQHRGVFSLFHSRKNKKTSKKNQESAVRTDVAVQCDPPQPEPPTPAQRVVTRH